MDYTAYRENLQALLNSRGLSKTQFAIELNLPLATISRHISGARSPELEYVVREADFFGVSVDWLLGRNDERFETLTPEIAEIVQLYSLAGPEDRGVIKTLLQRYKAE